MGVTNHLLTGMILQVPSLKLTVRKLKHWEKNLTSRDLQSPCLLTTYKKTPGMILQVRIPNPTRKPPWNLQVHHPMSRFWRLSSSVTTQPRPREGPETTVKAVMVHTRATRNPGKKLTSWGNGRFIYHYFTGFTKHPFGGWPWDFWSINSMT